MTKEELLLRITAGDLDFDLSVEEVAFLVTWQKENVAFVRGPATKKAQEMGITMSIGFYSMLAAAFSESYDSREIEVEYAGFPWKSGEEFEEKAQRAQAILDLRKKPQVG